MELSAIIWRLFYKSNVHNYDNIIASIHTHVMVVFQIEKFELVEKVRKTMAKKN